MERVTYSGLAHLRIYHKYTEGAWLIGTREGAEMIEKLKGIFGIHSPSEQMWECDTWHRDDFPPAAEGMKNVSIEVEAQLENRKIVPAIYARLDGRWYLAEGRYPRIQEEVIGWRRKEC